MKAYINESAINWTTIERVCILYASAYERGIRGAELSQQMNTAQELMSGAVDHERVMAVAKQAKDRTDRIRSEQRANLRRAAEPIIRTIRDRLRDVSRPGMIDVAALLSEAYPEIPAADRAAIATMI